MTMSEDSKDFKLTCEYCGEELVDQDNIIGRWCDDICADASDEAFIDEEEALDAELDDYQIFNYAEIEEILEEEENNGL